MNCYYCFCHCCSCWLTTEEHIRPGQLINHGIRIRAEGLHNFRQQQGARATSVFLRRVFYASRRHLRDNVGWLAGWLQHYSTRIFPAELPQGERHEQAPTRVKLGNPQSRHSVVYTHASSLVIAPVTTTTDSATTTKFNFLLGG